MIHLGNITKITPESTPVVDCITFGSPCQDLSIAGKRAGLAGERSGLFMEAVRVIKEMRLHSFGAYPKFAVWENVMGAFSSNKGDDFRAVLEELATIKEAGVSIPGPEKGKWAKAGFICGNGWSIAWRTFDAQYWGVPQRRRRIAVVVDFRGQCAGEVLFERKGVSGDSEPCIPSWQGIARNPEKRIAGYDYAAGEPVTYPGVGVTSKQNSSNSHPGDPCHTLNTDSRNYIVIPSAHTVKICSGCKCEGVGKGTLTHTEKSATLGAFKTGINGDIAGTLDASYYKGPGERSGVERECICEYNHTRWIVRRLTPTECERLQGFPDGWTDIGEWVDSKGKRHKAADSPRYKALGNSIALPQWWWLTCKMAKYLPERATLGSLFDGIGGFPLVWETLHGKGTAVWASEIDEFPIAVTKKHF